MSAEAFPSPQTPSHPPAAGGIKILISFFLCLEIVDLLISCRVMAFLWMEFVISRSC
jgi:hypothetical protein